MKTCRRGHEHDAERCPECVLIYRQRSQRHKTHGDAPPRVPLRLATHCPRGHVLAGRGLIIKGGKCECRACANEASRKRDAERRMGLRPPRQRQRVHAELSDVPVVVHRRERPATRDPWAALLFGGAP